MLVSQAKAEDFSVIDALKKLPDTKHGIAYDATSYRFNYLTTLGILKYGDFGLDAGFSSDDKAVATLSYDIGGLKKLGFSTPITDLIDLRVGIYGGYGRLTGSNEWSYGPTVTIVNVKF